MQCLRGPPPPYLRRLHPSLPGPLHLLPDALPAGRGSAARAGGARPQHPPRGQPARLLPGPDVRGRVRRQRALPAAQGGAGELAVGTLL